MLLHEALLQATGRQFSTLNEEFNDDDDDDEFEIVT